MITATMTAPASPAVGASSPNEFYVSTHTRSSRQGWSKPFEPVIGPSTTDRTLNVQLNDAMPFVQSWHNDSRIGVIGDEATHPVMKQALGGAWQAVQGVLALPGDDKPSGYYAQVRFKNPEGAWHTRYFNDAENVPEVARLVEALDDIHDIVS